MAFPLKSGADLYNQQLIRAAIWNHGADPSETVTGLLYFNTSNSSAAKKLRLHTGTEWKTIAFEEDLDVANNAEFKALEDKVKLLAGEVDTDAIISNMKEVSNFLAGFAEDAKLMSVLDGKLNKTGGTISNGAFNPLTIKGNSSYSGIGFEIGENKAGFLVYTGGVDWFVTNEGWGIGHKLLHAGNIGEYNAGGAEKLVGTYHGSEDASSNPYFWLNESGKTRYYLQAYNGNLCLGPTEQSLVINSSGNVTIGASDLAGTSANLVVGNNVIFCYNQTIKGGVDNGNFIIDAGDYSGWFAKGFGIKHNGTTLGQYGFYLGESNLHYMFIGKYDSPWISIRPNGNVGIGTPDPQHKFHVAGNIVANGTIACKGIAAEGDAMDMVDKTVLYIPSNNTEKTFTLNHGLGTREITISIYETTTLGTNMILTDVEILDENRISVSFGNPPTENHMVVVMG